MKRVFLDSSILVAACASKTGASALILGYCRRKKITGYISPDVIGEAKKNVDLKLDKTARKRLKSYLKVSNLRQIACPPLEYILLCQEVINEKDAPILAAALKNQAEFLLTLDRKHFLNNKVVAFVKQIKILTPGEFVRKYLKNGIVNLD